MDTMKALQEANEEAKAKQERLQAEAKVEQQLL